MHLNTALKKDVYTTAHRPSRAGARRTPREVPRKCKGLLSSNTDVRTEKERVGSSSDGRELGRPDLSCASKTE